MRFGAVLAAVCAALVWCSPAGAVKQGKYLQNCPLANVAQVDPMVNPGGVADHPHAEFGAVNWTASTTTREMLAGATTCFLTGNHSAYWVPTITATDGTEVAPTSAGGYYGAFGAADDEQVEPFPVGMRMIVGNSKSTVLQSASVVTWRCDYASSPLSTAPPTSCPDGKGVQVSFAGPKYWDGMNLDSPDHKSHLSYVKDATHTIRIPMLSWAFHYPAAAVGGCPSSDHGVPPCGRSMHMDLWEAQDPIMQAELTKCVNDPARSSASSPLCGLFTYFGGTNGVAPNPWLPSLIAWTNKVTYVQPDGSAAPLP